MNLISRIGCCLCLLALVALPEAGSQDAPAAPEVDTTPLLRWEVLRGTHYVPRTKLTFSRNLAGFHDQKVRVAGYLMRNFRSQDPSDLLVTALHPSSLICGPTDMTAIIEVYMPGFETDEWPTMPVEVVGTFFLSKNPSNLRFIYHIYGTSWRPLRRWVQDFPGVPDELLEATDPGGP